MYNFFGLLLKFFGWKVVVTVAEPTSSVICVAPHTSNWDFVIAEFLYKSLGRKSHFLMKKSWFFFPLGSLFSSIGGVPVDRSKPTSITEQMANEFKKHDHFHLAITPEGTRSLAKKWKTGFYYIALKANVPIQLAYIDYSKKEVGITEVLYPKGDEIADMSKIYDFYRNRTGYHAQKFYVPTVHQKKVANI